MTCIAIKRDETPCSYRSVCDVTSHAGNALAVCATHARLHYEWRRIDHAAADARILTGRDSVPKSIVYQG